MPSSIRYQALRRHAVAAAAWLALGAPLAQAAIITSGDIGAMGLALGPGDTDLGTTQVYVGLGLPGSLTVDGGSRLLAGGVTFGATALGTGSFSGVGTLVNLQGSGNRVEVGNAGTGSLTLSAGAVLQARDAAAACGFCGNYIGNGAGSNGVFTVTGAGSSASLWAMAVGNPSVFPGFGTPGGVARGAVSVLDGGYLESINNVIGGGPGGPAANGAERSFGSVLVSGANSTWRVTTNLVKGVDPFVTLAGHRNATAELEVRNGGLLLLDSVSGRFSSLAVGQQGRADVVVADGGRIQYGVGTGSSGLLQIGRNAGAQGSVLVQSGGVVDGAYYISVGRDGGTGALTVTGAGSLVRLNGDSTVNTGGNVPSVASMDVGRNTGTGRLAVTNGARVEIVATLSRGNTPALQVGRDAGSMGSVNIDGAASTVFLSAASTLPGGGAAEARNPLVRVGSLGTGLMNITNGGALVMQGHAISTQADSRSTSLMIGGVGDGASGGTGVLNLIGAGSHITQTGNDMFIGVGMGAGANGSFNVSGGATVNGMIFNVGRSSGVGVMSVDGASINLAGQQTGNNLAGAGFSVGSGGGTGVLNLVNGAQITINNAAGTVSAGGNIGGSGFFPGGQGVVTMSGNSRIDIVAPAGLGGLSVGRSGIGTLRMSGSHIDTHNNGGIVIGNNAGAVGTLVMSDGSTLGTDFVGVGRNRDAAGVTGNGGIATLVVNSGSTVTANTIEIGAQGYLGGNGTLVGNITNYGVINPGNSPGTLVIDGSFVNAAGGRIVLEVESDGAGGFVTDHLIFSEASSVNLSGTQLVFSFLGDTDPNAFKNSGNFDVDNFIQQQVGSGTQALGDAAFAGVSFVAESQTYAITGFSYSATGGVSNFTTTPVPEPGTSALLLAGIATLGWLARRRRA